VSPPSAPGIPGTRLPPAAAKRPRISNPPPAEAAVQIEEADDRPSVVEFQRAVHAQYGNAQFHGPAWVLIAVLLVAALAVIVYLLATRPSAPTAANQCLTKDQFEASMRERDERTSRRFDTLETDTSYLKVALRLVQDRLPPQK
jgi:hypothetical protein